MNAKVRMADSGQRLRDSVCRGTMIRKRSAVYTYRFADVTAIGSYMLLDKT
jgi:hypothetical protein